MPEWTVKYTIMMIFINIILVVVVNLIVGPGWNVREALHTKNVKRIKENFPYFKKNFIAKQFMLGLRGTVPWWFLVITFVLNIGVIVFTVVAILHIITMSIITEKILDILRMPIIALISFKALIDFIACGGHGAK